MSTLSAEWTKIRTVRSTVWTLLLTLVISVGLAQLIGMSLDASYEEMEEDRVAAFDPVLAGFYSLTLGQLSLVVFGVLLVSSEYSSGTIRASLTAVPNRRLFFGSKVLVGAAVAFAFSAVVGLCTFFVGQGALGSHGTSLGSGGVPRAVAGATVYMTLMCVFSMGVAAMLRSTALSLGIMLPLLFLGSQGLFNLPKLRTVAQYLPDQAGMVMMQVVPQDESSIIHRDFGPWTALAILVAWTGLALIGGHLTLQRRDA